MTNMVVELAGVSKSFGELKVLDNINLRLEKGKAYGLVGDNGSGKSVLMRLLCGFSDADEGTITVLGESMSTRADHRGQIGVIIETPAFVSRYSARANLNLLSSILGICSKNEIETVLETVGLKAAGRKPVGKFSLGMRQRLAIAQAIMEEPPILILDEPFNGLDRHGMADIRTLLAMKKKEGTTILLTSHYRQDIDALCDTVFILENGLLSLDTPECIKGVNGNEA